MFDIEALQTPGYSLKTALAMALASQLSYSDKDTVISTAKGWGFDDVQHLSSDDTQGFIATKDDIVMVAFRGTESTGDWLTNIQISKKRITYGRVHKGFFKAFKDVRDAVRSALAQQAFRNRFFCGHSLGGALATIAMAETADIPATNTAGYTYGQPKVGKRDFRDRFNDETQDSFFRYVNDGDIVARVPPNFRHVQLLHKLTEDPHLEAAPVDDPELSEDEFKDLQAQIESALEEYRSLESVGTSEDEYLEGIIPGVDAHSMDLYIARIKERLDLE